MDSGGGFWIFIAAVVVGGMWYEARQKAEKHETLRRIVEKTGTIDEAKLKELFSAAPSDGGRPGGGYRALRVWGTIIMFAGAGMATFFLLAAALGKVIGATEMFRDIAGWIAGVSISVGVVILGMGMFLSSRFAERPPGQRNEPPAR
jgi:hypothetical protein